MKKKYINIIRKDFNLAIKEWQKSWQDCGCDNCLADYISHWFAKRPQKTN